MKKINILILVAFLMLLVFVPLMAQDVTGGEMGIEQIILYLTPFIVYGAGLVVKLVKPHIPGWAMMGFVGALSAAVVWITNLTLNPDLSVLLQFTFGLLSVFIHQLFKQFSSEKRAEDSTG